MGDFGAVGAVVILLGSGFLLVLAICWIVLPFALIGTKPLLREILNELREQNRRANGGADGYRGSGSAARDMPPDTQPQGRDFAADAARRQRQISALPPT
jgi:type II secretory pathway component PulM